MVLCASKMSLLGTEGFFCCAGRFWTQFGGLLPGKVCDLFFNETLGMPLEPFSGLYRSFLVYSGNLCELFGNCGMIKIF